MAVAIKTTISQIIQSGNLLDNIAASLSEIVIASRSDAPLLVDAAWLCKKASDDLKAEFEARTGHLNAEIDRIREEYASLLSQAEDLREDARFKLQEIPDITLSPVKGLVGQATWRASTSLVITDESKIEPRFCKPDPKMVKAALTAGLEIEGAELEQTMTLVISGDRQ